MPNGHCQSEPVCAITPDPVKVAAPRKNVNAALPAGSGGLNGAATVHTVELVTAPVINWACVMLRRMLPRNRVADRRAHCPFGTVENANRRRRHGRGIARRRRERRSAGGSPSCCWQSSLPALPFGAGVDVGKFCSGVLTLMFKFPAEIVDPP